MTPSGAQLGSSWHDSFMCVLREADVAVPLKHAALSRQMGDWTRLLTAAVVRSCRDLGWLIAAKGFALDLLPQAGQEYLGMDVMAFAPPQESGGRWAFPVAVFELENSRADDRVAYSLWKVLCLRCPLRVVFAYRDDWRQARALLDRLSQDVIGTIPISHRGDLPGQTLVILGSHGEGETFPWGYFKLWELNANLGRFEKS